MPRNIQTSGKVLLVQAGLVVLLFLLLGVIGNLDSTIDRLETEVLKWIAGVRSPGLTTVMRSIDGVLASQMTLGILVWGIVIALVILKRFRHLFVFLGAILGVGVVTTFLALLAVRARPIGVEILGDWEGGSVPSRPMAMLAAVLLGIVYTLVVPGRPRDIAKLLEVRNNMSQLLFEIDRSPDHPALVTFDRSCDLSGARSVPSDEPQAKAYLELTEIETRLQGARHYVFPGGCATYDFDFPTEGGSRLAQEMTTGITFTTRKAIAQQVFRDKRLVL